MPPYHFAPLRDVMPHLRQYGAASHSFATLATGLRWVGGDDFAVAYVDTGKTWVIAGPPLCAPAQAGEVIEALTRHAAARKRAVVFFAISQTQAAVPGLRHFCVGQDALCDTSRWPATAARRTRKEQRRRARAKGVVISEGVATQGVATGRLPPNHAALAHLTRQWLASRPLAPMKFMLEIDLLRAPSERIWCFAHRDGDLIGAAIGSPIYASRGMLLEHVLRSPQAPNGTTDALIDGFMQICRRRGIAEVSLGLVPLHGEVPSWLMAAGVALRRCYDFRGLAAFKARLRPDRWQPLYIAHNCANAPAALLATCRAFCGVGLAAFAAASVIKHLRDERWPRTWPGRAPAVTL